VHHFSSVGAMTNNSHVLVTAVDALITCFTALKLKHATNNEGVEGTGERDGETKAGDGVVLKPLHVEKKKFVECAAYNLLYMRSMENKKEWKMYPVRSMFAILEQFVVEARLDRSILDRIIGHPLLHAAYVEMSIGKNRGVDDSRRAAETFRFGGEESSTSSVRRKSVSARRNSLMKE
jgi:hypothetical protein